MGVSAEVVWLVVISEAGSTVGLSGFGCGGRLCGSGARRQAGQKGQGHTGAYDETINNDSLTMDSLKNPSNLMHVIGLLGAWCPAPTQEACRCYS